jgi:hypothetical protein
MIKKYVEWSGYWLISGNNIVLSLATLDTGNIIYESSFWAEIWSQYLLNRKRLCYSVKINVEFMFLIYPPPPSTKVENE